MNILNKIIFETSHHPFGRSAYSKNENISDFVGRKEELHQFKEYIQQITTEKNSLAIRLEGPAGVGKSTLFNYLKQAISIERVDETSLVQYLNKDLDILSSYFQLPGNVTNFRSLWTHILEGLSPDIDAETGSDMGFLEYTMLKFIYRLFNNDMQALSEIIWKNDRAPTDLKYINLNDLINPILNNTNTFIPDIQEYYKQNKRKIREMTKVEINSTTYQLKRSDNNLISQLFRVFDEDDPTLDNYKNGDKSYFKNDDDLISFFNTLTTIYSCSTKKELIFLVGIDEIVKFSSLGSSNINDTEYYSNLGNLLIRMRNELNLMLFVFISTTEDWARFDQSLREKTDLMGQLTPILKNMALKQLEVEETIDVFKKRMRGFWSRYSSKRSSYQPYYPYSQELFEYVYRYKMRDLRPSIIFLNDMWMSIRYDKYIPPFNDMFDILRYVRKVDSQQIDGSNIKKFEWEIINRYFEKSHYNKSNAARSSMIEKGFTNAWKCLQQERYTDITSVQNNPLIKTSSGNRRPDVYMEINGNLGRDYTRYIEFQVKAYSKENKVEYKHISSSIELFNEKYSDAMYFLTTGGGLDSRAFNTITQMRNDYPNRIFTPTLTNTQKQWLIFLGLYKEIMGWKLGKNQQIDEQVAEISIEMVLNQKITPFINHLKTLSRRTLDAPFEPEKDDGFADFFGKDEGTKETPIVPPSISPIPPIEDIRTPAQPVGEKEWLKNYPKFDEYKHEACSLGEYLRGRESGRYAGKFTIATVVKNVIRNDIYSDIDNFKDMVTMMKDENLLDKVKTSFIITTAGHEWYEQIKADGFKV